jgi:hypothetical protein
MGQTMERGSRVRCFTRNGHDWADRFPAIVDAAQRIKANGDRVDAPYRSGPQSVVSEPEAREGQAGRLAPPHSPGFST